jgi:myo-inositol catabolism protein IolC
MTARAGQRLYILSFDHRGSFKKGLMGIAGEPTGDERQRISELKTLIYEGFMRAIARGAPRDSCGLLVDEEFGADVARSARRDAFRLAMPVERSGQEEFDFEFGEDFGEHVEAFDPDFAKVLVRYNPDGDAELNYRQAARLARLSGWLRANDRKFLFELLVPATADQRERVGGDQDAYDRDLRPELVVRTLAELQEAGVEPDIWKIEGLEASADCERAITQARAGGRDQVTCVVLGRGANLDRVAHWLRAAAPVEGYVGLAVGRTIWLDALSEHVAGRLERDAAIERIAANYRRMIDVYAGAAAGTSPDDATDVEEARSFDPERGSFDPPRHPSLTDPQANPRGVRHIDETAQDQMAVKDRPRYQAAEGRRARMIAAAAATKRRLRGLLGSRTVPPGSSPPESEA